MHSTKTAPHPAGEAGFGDSTDLVSDSDRARVATRLRIGQIGYLNIAPMHYALGIDPALVGTPADLNSALLDGRLDAACISSIEFARHADDLELLPSMCIAADGAVGSIFAISNGSFDSIRTVYTTPASATSVVLLDVLLQLRGITADFRTLDTGAEEVLSQPGTAVLLIGDDAMAAPGAVELRNFEFTDLGTRWHDETGLPMVYAVWAVRRDAVAAEPDLVEVLDRMLVESVRKFSVSPDAVRAASAEHGVDEHAARSYFDRLCYSFGPRERTGLIRFLRAAHEIGALDAMPALVHESDHAATATGDTIDMEAIRTSYAASVGTRSALRTRPEDAEHAERMIAMETDARDLDVDAILQSALNDERINETEATALLISRRLTDVGSVAHELRMRRAPADLVTFIVDRNINYTNICVTDCGFCAFYRRPGDASEGYVHSTETILEKIAETIELGGTAALLQGGHNPDLGIEYYVDLFTTVKQRFPGFHLHALSPPEIQHIARRSKMSNGEVLAALRDAGLDSLPGGGGEVLVDRVRRVIAPKKTKTDEWLGVMREAHRIGMSTTASMMYGHAELLGERVEHMRRIREVQDEHRGFRAFISWTFQAGATPLAHVLEHGLTPYAEHLPASPTPVDYLMMQAVSRIYLDNVDNIQSSWVTQGMKVGQAALQYGANDMGSIMIEENVVSSAGTTFRATVQDFVHAITATGMRAVQRDTLYRTVQEHVR